VGWNFKSCKFARSVYWVVCVCQPSSGGRTQCI